jgi:glycosyltransferase involved in cell wall biosynthesis
MIVHAYYPIGETRVERQAQALVSCGYQVDVLCLRDRGEAAIDHEDGVNIYRLPVKRHKQHGATIQMLEYLAFFLFAFVKVTALHRRHRYPVVQVHNLPDFLVFAALIPKLTGARLILDLHDLMPEFYAARFSGNRSGWLVGLVELQEKIACAFADHVVTVTELWRQTLIERGVPPSKCSVVMNVADSRLFHPGVKVDIPERENGALHLIYHGNITRRYGLDVAIQAIDLVRRDMPHVHLKIHGRGPFLAALMEMVRSLGLEDHVELSTASLPSTELPRMIRSADVGIVPYRSDVFTDGILPTKLMEYAALGMPVIAARTPAIAAYFDDTMVQFFTPGDAQGLARCIQALNTDCERRKELVHDIDKFNQRYHWDELGNDYVALVERQGSR